MVWLLVMFNILAYLILIVGFFLGLVMGILLLIFPDKIIKWGERNFAEYHQWYLQQFDCNWVYKYRKKFLIFYTWLFRIVGACLAILCIVALILLISFWF